MFKQFAREVNTALPKLEATRPLRWSKYAITFNSSDQLKCAATAGALPMLCSPIIGNVLVTKTLDACARHGVPRLLLGGGVIANKRLRDVALERAEAAGVAVRIPPLSLCTDNGAMIAALGSAVVRRGLPPSSLDLPVDSSMPLTQVLV